MDKTLSFLDGLGGISDFAIVPGWRWTDELWRRFRRRFAAVPMCRDDFGNVYLNCVSLEELFASIDGGRALVLQAHLDHPGGLLAGSAAKENGRVLHAAVWHGSYRPKLEGMPLALVDPQGSSAEDAVADGDVVKCGERVLFFWHDRKLAPPHSVRHPGAGSVVDEDGRRVCGWALDDALNAAILLDLFGGERPRNVFGLLTLDEECGGAGIRHFQQLVERRCGGKNPTVINVEAPSEEEATGFIPGGGIRIRTADARCAFSADLCRRLGRALPGVPAVEIKGGGTEASFLVERGWQAAGLALPIRFAHNGSREEMWCAEEASLDDALAMRKAVFAIVHAASAIVPRAAATDRRHGLPADAVIVNDEASPILERVRTAASFGDCLLSVSKALSEHRKKFNATVGSFSNDDYRRLRRRIEEGRLWQPDPDRLRAQAAQALAQLCDLFGVVPQAPLTINVVVSESFNAKTVAGGIGLSVLAMTDEELPRVLFHEITHWLIGDRLRARYPREIVRALLNEGIACFVSGERGCLPPHKALFMSPEHYRHLCEHDREIKQMFRTLMSGSWMSVRGKRHPVLTSGEVFDPFTGSASNPFNRYGYYLGLHFVEFCRRAWVTVQELTESQREAHRLLDDFLASEPVSEPKVPASHERTASASAGVTVEV